MEVLAILAFIFATLAYLKADNIQLENERLRQHLDDIIKNMD